MAFKLLQILWLFTGLLSIDWLKGLDVLQKGILLFLSNDVSIRVELSSVGYVHQTQFSLQRTSGFYLDFFIVFINVDFSVGSLYRAALFADGVQKRQILLVFLSSFFDLFLLFDFLVWNVAKTVDAVGLYCLVLSWVVLNQIVLNAEDMFLLFVDIEELLVDLNLKDNVDVLKGLKVDLLIPF